MSSGPTTPRDLTFYSINESVPGPGWLELYKATAPGYRSWYLTPDGSERPSLACAEGQLRRHMPELVPTWERLRDLTDDDPDMTRLLTMWSPPRFLPGCSQAVLLGDEPVLIRNYDYDPNLCERVVATTRWNTRRVLGTSDCLWGLVDGMNDRGLAGSLTYAGRAGAGDGFGIPLVVRYVLETCDTVAEVRATLARLPVHMAYNVTVVDGNADVSTFFVAPGQAPEEFTTGVATNHRGQQPEDVVHARRFKSVERQKRLINLMHAAPTSGELEQRFLEPPLYSAQWDAAFGTVYTAAYRPTHGTLDLIWPTTRWRRTFDSPSATHQVTLGGSTISTPTTTAANRATNAAAAQKAVKAAADRTESRTVGCARDGLVTGPGDSVPANVADARPTRLTYLQPGPDTGAMNETEERQDRADVLDAHQIGDQARRAIAALADSEDPAAFNELLTLSSEVGAALGASARNLANNQSWAGVGQYAGLSRQTAWARWGKTEVG